MLGWGGSDLEDDWGEGAGSEMNTDSNIFMLGGC
jgi:hypothetical protein